MQKKWWSGQSRAHSQSALSWTASYNTSADQFKHHLLLKLWRSSPASSLNTSPKMHLSLVLVSLLSMNSCLGCWIDHDYNTFWPEPLSFGKDLGTSYEEISGCAQMQCGRTAPTPLEEPLVCKWPKQPVSFHMKPPRDGWTPCDARPCIHRISISTQALPWLSKHGPPLKPLVLGKSFDSLVL